MGSDREERGLGFQAFCLAVSAGVFDVFLDVVAEVAALAKVGEILGSDVVFVMLVGIHREWLAEVGGGEDNDGSGDGMGRAIFRLAPFAPALRPPGNCTDNSLPGAGVSGPIDRHGGGGWIQMSSWLGF